MKDVLVSMIIPVYNVERYITRCLQSIIDQTHKALEIIPVDDGSPDKCGAIIDEFAAKDSRVIPVHKTNGGVSSARNAGLDITRGEYVMFVDGDDYVEADYVDYFLSIITHGEGGHYVAVDTNHFSIRNSQQVARDNIRVVPAEWVIEKIYAGGVDVAVWNKIYSRDFLESNHIRFREDIWYGEGMLFNITCLQEADSVVVGERRVYHQTENPNSAMRSFKMENQYCGLRSLDVQRSIWKKSTPEIEAAYNFHRRGFNWSILTGIIRTGSTAQYRKEYEQSIRNLRRDLSVPLKANISIKQKIKALLIAVAPVLVAHALLLKGRIYHALFRKRAE